MTVALHKIDWFKYPERTCRSLHECRVCGGGIVAGQKYRDGGYGRRAHSPNCPTASGWVTCAHSGCSAKLMRSAIAGFEPDWDWFTGVFPTTLFWCPLHRESEERAAAVRLKRERAAQWLEEHRP